MFLFMCLHVRVWACVMRAATASQSAVCSYGTGVFGVWIERVYDTYVSVILLPNFTTSFDTFTSLRNLPSLELLTYKL